MTDPPDRLKAALADRYALEREIGRGGMATVWLAQDVKHHRKVAVKVLDPELAQTLGAGRFLREVETAANLQHPHILPLHDSGEADGFLYYVMPYVEGESLRDRLNREKQLPVDDALQISREVADALSYAHAHGVIHRDVKPENILLAAGHAVVADFGIARAVDQAGGGALTGTGMAVGTPAYMSPEQAAGSREMDGRSDLYSLGCVLYEMLAGHPPFTGPTAERLLLQHLTVEPPNITAIRPAVPAQVAATLERALAKTPADRFNPVAQFAEALGSRGFTGPSSGPVPAAQPTPRRPANRWMALLGIAAVAVAIAIGVGRWMVPGSTGSDHLPTAIAVLPFQNLSPEGPHSYFAGGLHDEVLTQLTKVAALTPTSRTSVMGYAGTTKPIRVIAQELSVGTIVEGSVQVVEDRLRVNVQLIDAVTDKHLWAESYDRSLDDAFAVQSDIAQRIAAAVGTQLSRTEATAIAQRPTEDPEAYRLYLQGMEYWRRPGYERSHQEIAQDFFQQAVALDSTFALAYAALSQVHGRIHFLRQDPSPSRLLRQREAAEEALRLAPGLPQTHFALGSVYYYGRRDMRAALQEYQTALAGMPNDAELWARIGYANRRLGNWAEALAALDKAVSLDPRNPTVLYDLGGRTNEVLGRYEEAVAWLSKALALAPDMGGWDLRRGSMWVLWHGRPDSLRVALDRRADSEGWLSHWGADYLLLERKPDSLLALLNRITQPVFEWDTGYLPKMLHAAQAHRLRGDGVAARAAFDSALVLLDSVASVFPDDWRVHAARGLALAGLSQHERARREARRLQESQIYREDPHQGPYLAEYRAIILAQIGDTGAALAEIERLLSGPSWLSVHTLRLDPRWDPLRDDPRFQALLVKYANPEPVK